jgi:hypothetical protein
MVRGYRGGLSPANFCVVAPVHSNIEAPTQGRASVRTLTGLAVWVAILIGIVAWELSLRA